ETQYFLNSVTKQYIKEKSVSLEFHKAIVERVRSFRAGALKKSRELINLEKDFERYISRQDYLEIKSLFEKTYDAKLTENPGFRKLRGRAFLLQSPPKIIDAREDFKFCVQMNHEDAEIMRLWLQMEKENNSPAMERIDICNHVINGKSYASEVKHEFISKRASIYY
ncbi:unnamed protein product, partial [Ectocarpus sp. 8 AP-2014]